MSHDVCTTRVSEAATSWLKRPIAWERLTEYCSTVSAACLHMYMAACIDGLLHECVHQHKIMEK